MTTSLINKSGMKNFILEKCAQLRQGHKFTRVSSEAIEKYEAKLRAMIEADIRTHPSIGKTFRP